MLLLAGCPKPPPPIVDAGSPSGADAGLKIVVDAGPAPIVDAGAPPRTDDAGAGPSADEGEVPKRTVFEKDVEADLLGIVDGGLVPAPPTRVAHFTCTTADTSEDEQRLNRRRCESSLDLLEADGGDVFASARFRAPDGLDYELAGGNGQDLDVGMFMLDPDNGFLATSLEAREGDMEMTFDSELKLWALQGDELVCVLSVQTVSGKAGAKREMSLAPGKKRTNGVLNIIGTVQVTDGSNSRTEYVTFVWTGAKYVDKKTLPK